MRVIENALLRPYNTFGVEARARYLVWLDTLTDLAALLNEPRFTDMPRLILGGGSNLLFRDDFEGVVALIRFKGIQIVNQDESYIYIRAAAGENWHCFVLRTLALGYGGLENLSLIPGTVGAAPMQNIGAYGVELSDRFESLEAVDLTDGQLRTFDRDACRFGYRNSVFKTLLRDRYLIASVTVRLPLNPAFITGYAGIDEELERLSSMPVTAQRISEAVCRIRQLKLPSPETIGNAGSFFKNPVVNKTTWEDLRERFPGLVAFPLTEGEVKLSAAWLIEQEGWKGYRQRDAGVYDRHALVLVNYGAATGQDIWRLAETIMASVEERFGVSLEPEPLIL